MGGSRALALRPKAADYQCAVGTSGKLGEAFAEMHLDGGPAVEPPSEQIRKGCYDGSGAAEPRENFSTSPDATSGRVNARWAGHRSAGRCDEINCNQTPPIRTSLKVELDALDVVEGELRDVLGHQCSLFTVSGDIETNRTDG